MKDVATPRISFILIHLFSALSLLTIFFSFQKILSVADTMNVDVFAAQFPAFVLMPLMFIAPLIICFYIWQQEIKRLTFVLLPNEDLSLPEEIWWQRRLGYLTPIQQLWRVWTIKEIRLKFYNASTLWSFVFIVSIVMLKFYLIVQKLIKNPQELLNWTYTMLTLQLMLIFLTLYISRKIQNAVHRHIRNASLGSLQGKSQKQDPVLWRKR